MNNSYKKNYNSNDILILVNKNNILDKNYIPSDLEKIDNNYSIGTKYLRHEAKENFEKLCIDAEKNNLNIKAESTYRNYEYQAKLYNNYVKQYGVEYADKTSAKAGCSEHQTGLAVDVRGSNGDYNLFEKSKEFKWMLNNCYKYGFILRYLENKTPITGYKYEPWHYRYVGKIAKIIMQQKITLEEYLINNNTF